MKVPPSPTGGPPPAPRRRTRSGEVAAARPSSTQAPDTDASGKALWAPGRAGGARKEARAQAREGTAPASPGAQAEGASSPRRAHDGFGAAQTQGEVASRRVRETLGAEVPQALPTGRTGGEDAVSALNRAQPPGVYWREEGQERRQDEDEEDPELAEAVEEAIRLLFGVPGILRVGPGRDQEDQPVVLIVAARGFGAASLARVPETVHRFRTLLVMPYDLLPLRRL